jgi:hypothetical protein
MNELDVKQLLVISLCFMLLATTRHIATVWREMRKVARAADVHVKDAELDASL